MEGRNYDPLDFDVKLNCPKTIKKATFKLEDLLVIGTRCFKFPTQALFKERFFWTSLIVYAVQLAMPHATVLNIDDVTLIGRTNRQPYAIQRIGQ